jgi:molybdenum cofactor cytidylyltransferase
MGRPKISLVWRGRTLLERALDAAVQHPTLVVVGSLPPTESTLLKDRARTSDLRVIVNDAPQLGMSHSLALADAAIANRTSALAVLLVDTPLVDAPLLARIAAARGDADVAFPVRCGVPGHPVIFGPRARALIGALPAGDTLRELRDHPNLRRVCIETEDDAPFIDVDTPDDFNELPGTP